MKELIHTPWGYADQVEHIADGIAFYSTPRHGGFKLSIERVKQCAPAHQVHLKSGGVGVWYEEDCEAAKVILAFPQYFTADQVETAQQSFEHWFNPDGTYKSNFGSAL